MTFHEFSCAIRAYQNRIDLQRRLLAWTQANLMACWTKHPPSINRLMGAKSLLGMSRKDVSEHYAAKKGSN